MAYKMMIKVIKAKSQSKETVLKKVDVFYASGRLTDDEYEELIALINEVYA